MLIDSWNKQNGLVVVTCPVLLKKEMYIYEVFSMYFSKKNCILYSL